MTHLRLLTIGNSFSNNALTYLRPIAASRGVRFTIGRASIGGCTLEKHWNLCRFTERHPDFIPYPNGAAEGDDPREGNLQSLLRAEPWDIVTLQQQSGNSWRAETFEPYLERLMGVVGELAPTAEIRLHQTWAYRIDAPLLREWGMTAEQMHARIEAVFAELRRRTGLATIPSGPALHRVRQMPDRQYRVDPEFDFDRAEPFDLPDQRHSLANGYHWNIAGTPDGKPQLLNDANHLNFRGCYIASAAWFEHLTGLDVRETDFCPAGLTRADREAYCDAAHAAVAERGRG